MAVFRHIVLGITILAFAWASRCPLAASGAPCERLLSLAEIQAPVAPVAPPAPMHSRADDGLRQTARLTVVAAVVPAAPARCVFDAGYLPGVVVAVAAAPVPRPPFSLPPSRAPPPTLVG